MKFKKKYRFALALVLFVLLCGFRKASVLIQIDQWFYEVAQGLSYSEPWLKFWYAPTVLGDGRFVYTLAAVIGIYLLFNDQKFKIIVYVLFLFALFLSNTWLKDFFALERPVGLAPFYDELSTYSFPSGHAVNSVMLFYFLPQLLKKIGAQISVYNLVLFLGIGLISFSRIFLGVHWFFDVVGGVLWGFIISGLGLFTYEKI